MSQAASKQFLADIANDLSKSTKGEIEIPMRTAKVITFPPESLITLDRNTQTVG